MKILNLNEGLRVTEAGIMLSAATGCNEQLAVAAGQRNMTMLVFLL